MIKLKVRPNPNQFKKNNLFYTLLKGHENAVLYEIRAEGYYGLTVGYEVQKLRLKQIPPLFKSLPGWGEYTHYLQQPCNEEIGSWGWSYDTISLAMNKYGEILRGE